jgi:hypothetical protein
MAASRALLPLAALLLVASQVEDARASQAEDAGASQAEDAGASQVEDAGASQVEDAGASQVEDAVPLSAKQVAERWHGRLDQRHFTARVRLEMSLAGLREQRRLLIWRDDDGWTERVMVRFESPADLRDVGLLYLEQTGRPNDYFLYQPALRRIRRLPQSVANADVYGIDLEFLGFGVAQTEPTEIESMRMEVLEERRTYRLTERALHANPRFDERTTWIDATHFLPVRTEHRRRGRVVLIATTLETAELQGVPTPVRARFERPGGDRRVSLEVESVDYEAPIPEDYFSTLALIRSQLGHSESE